MLSQVVLAGLLAEHLLDRRVHENARDLRIGRRALDQLRVQRRPDVRIDCEGILEHRGGADVLALLRRENAVGHGREPDIGVEPDLMAGMTGDHRPAARLRHVADEEARPAVEATRVACQTLEIVEQAGMSPIAIAREPDHSCQSGPLMGKETPPERQPLA